MHDVKAGQRRRVFAERIEIGGHAGAVARMFEAGGGEVAAEVGWLRFRAEPPEERLASCRERGDGVCDARGNLVRRNPWREAGTDHAVVLRDRNTGDIAKKLRRILDLRAG